MVLPPRCTVAFAGPQKTRAGDPSTVRTPGVQPAVPAAEAAPAAAGATTPSTQMMQTAKRVFELRVAAVTTRCSFSLSDASRRYGGSDSDTSAGRTTFRRPQGRDQAQNASTAAES